MIEENLSPEEAAAAQVRSEHFDRNSDWLQAHVPEVYTNYRGKCICVAGQELFAADTITEAVATAKAAHPEDQGPLTRYIPKDRVARIYAI
jgi:hypothetical protein